VEPYPWDRLVTLPRECVGLLFDARRALARALDEAKITEALAELLGERVTVHVSSVAVEAEQAALPYESSFVLATSDDGVRVRMDLDRQLARALVARVVGRPGGLGDPRAATPPEIEGALLAIVCAVARRAHGSGESLHPVGPGAWAMSPGERYLSVRASVMIGADAYGVNAAVQMRRPFVAPSMSARDELSSLGELPISVPVVIAVASASAGDLYGMAAGDVFLPGSGWMVNYAPGALGARRLSGEVIFAVPGRDRGITGTLGEGGEIVVVGVKATPPDAEAIMTTSDRSDETATSEVILDAPLVVRVELGAVTLAAREWAALGPGDVIVLSKRVSEPVVLRIAGLEVARGELVDIEGELGVRIRERIHSS
jgi:flagellar motor switch/type III secretory pathway protein FliN